MRLLVTTAYAGSGWHFSRTAMDCVLRKRLYLASGFLLPVVLL